MYCTSNIYSTVIRSTVPLSHTLNTLVKYSNTTSLHLDTHLPSNIAGQFSHQYGNVNKHSEKKVAIIHTIHRFFSVPLRDQYTA